MSRATCDLIDKPGWVLAFHDEFDGPGEDLDARWEFHNQSHGHILCSRWRENVVVQDGLCRLLNRKESRGGQEWTSGSMWTRHRQKYGLFEARFRYAAATGLNNAFWLFRLDEQGGIFEIDINEGHHPNEVAMTFHNYRPKLQSQSLTHKAAGRDLCREFHVYGFEWTPREMIWYFDGVEMWRLPNEVCHDEAAIYLSSAILNCPGMVTDAIDGTSMDIDWVRAYRRDS